MKRYLLIIFCSLAVGAFAAEPVPSPPPPAPVSTPGAALMEVPSPTGLINQRLPSWIRFNGELRFREEGFLGSRFQEDNDDLHLLERVRVGVFIKPYEWLQFFAQGQDARLSFNTRIPSAPPYQDSADLRQAYVQLGGEQHTFDLKVGRQEMSFGEERLVGPGNWANNSRTWDAVRLAITRGNYRVDAFASSLSVSRDHEPNRRVDGDNFHGLYGRIDNWIPKGRIEPYVYWRLGRSVLNERSTAGRLDAKTYGLRLIGVLPQSFEYTAEMVAQRGSWAGDEVAAWAGFWRFGRQFPSIRWAPRLRLEINHSSGDSDPRDGRHETLDVLYATPHDKYGLADQVGWKNMNHIGLILEGKPRANLTLQAKFHNWWLANATDGLYNAGGALLYRDPLGQSGKYIGKEFDVQVLWNPAKNVAVGGGVGHLLPGGFLDAVSPGHSYTFPYVMLTYGL